MKILTNLLFISLFLLFCGASETHLIIVTTQIDNMNGFPIYTDPDCHQYIDKVTVEIQGSVSNTQNIPMAGYAVKVFRNSNNDCSDGPGAVQIGASFFSSPMGAFDKELLIDVDNQIYACCNCRIENYKIFIKVFPLTMMENPAYHTIFGQKTACGDYDDAIFD